MYSINRQSKIKKTAILLSLMFGFIMILNTATQAQDNRDYRENRRDDRYYGNNYDAARIAQQYGYRDGMNDGADAAREGDRYHPQNSGDWQKGTNGYESRYGSKSAYKQAYRDAYLQGYRAGYNRNDRSNRRNNRRRDW